MPESIFFSKFTVIVQHIGIAHYVSYTYMFHHCSDVTFDKDITLYIHVFIYHAGHFALKYGPLKAFEMESVEQLNYVNKLVFRWFKFTLKPPYSIARDNL